MTNSNVYNELTKAAQSIIDIMDKEIPNLSDEQFGALVDLIGEINKRVEKFGAGSK